jgi:phage shock protein A
VTFLAKKEESHREDRNKLADALLDNQKQHIAALGDLKLAFGELRSAFTEVKTSLQALTLRVDQIDAKQRVYPCPLCKPKEESRDSQAVPPV